MKLVETSRRPETAALHPEALREVASVLRFQIDELFRSEMGFYPSDKQAFEALAYALGDSILFAGGVASVMETRARAIEMMDRATSAQIRGVMLGDQRDG